MSLPLAEPVVMSIDPDIFTFLKFSSIPSGVVLNTEHNNLRKQHEKPHKESGIDYIRHSL